MYKKEFDIFFCDIIGTFTSDDLINRHDELIKFINTLEYLSNNKLIFCFISTLPLTDFNHFFKEFKKYKTNKIVLGKQFFEDDAEFKYYSILNYLNELSTNYQINTCYYADDTVLFHHLLHELNENKYNIKSFIPGNEININNYFSSSNTGIVGLNNCIKEYLKSKSKILKI